MSLPFTKYHGLGNDFILVFEEDVDAGRARQLCDRHFGVGADGVIVVRRSEIADFSFLLFNADGGIAEVSGNGLRCVGKFLYEKGYHPEPVIKIEAAGDTKVLELVLEGGLVEAVRVDMGVASEEGDIELHGFHWRRVSIGNPHAVTFVDDVDAAPVTEIGPLVERDPVFPNRTNVEFARAAGEVIDVRFWERGVGVTLASGSGSCAAVVAAGLTRATVRTLGGDLSIQRDDAGRLFMTGPATHVFDGVAP
ncbi:MAG: diaminopimelate epimerase [Actinomycetota bacterium]